MSDRIVCPVHGMSDCSPLLNGCNRVNELWAEREKCGGSITAADQEDTDG